MRLATLLPLLFAAPLAHGQAPTAVTAAGNFQSELGCPGDWQPECATTTLTFDSADGVWQRAFMLPAGTWEYKAALNGSWTESYPSSFNRTLTLDASRSVKFYYDPATTWPRGS